MFSRKYVKTLQEKNERLFEDLENAHRQIDHWEGVSARRGMEILSLKDSLEVEKEKVEYLTGVIKGLNEEARKASEGSVAMLSDLRLAESAYESLNELLQKVTESLKESGERQLELEEENNHLREELNDAMVDIERLKEQSKNPYPTVTINVDVRDTLTVQLSKALKQANEAFEKRSKEKRFSFSFYGIDYSSDSRAELSKLIDKMFHLSLHDYASLLRFMESLEEELEQKDFASGGYSLYSKTLKERVNITFKATKEDI